MTKYQKKIYIKLGKNIYIFFIIFLNFYQGYFCHFEHEMIYCNPNNRLGGIAKIKERKDIANYWPVLKIVNVLLPKKQCLQGRNIVFFLYLFW
jgi:hypothetical protein